MYNFIYIYIYIYINLMFLWSNLVFKILYLDKLFNEKKHLKIEFFFYRNVLFLILRMLIKNKILEFIYIDIDIYVYTHTCT